MIERGTDRRARSLEVPTTLKRLVPFDCKELLYFDYNPLLDEAAKVAGACRVDDIKKFVS
ncbi:formate dehydrogenase (NAD+) [Ceratobasidium sp. 428]|nr:formate dehydrogenase (NAD+) [Ceratobasidium sp. 428]